ncbi:PTS system N-acetylglucosamine-specific IIA component (Glc family) [Halopolyspora algeriensis]|uniref:PTS system N-acetylglucosamine-specific IIA component (Glc family) n=1 Tax=Halopolyspora algeriensis TaxID=1500506 RepID=A0A368VPV0_9ACTN|nr:PTS glucose transporter subunit IIA [Halopolyspora algeriensis]RCW43881.1 PTS system N-acetylglucosamine-specific IIA component (Glc family) [Halopolyspora algeriensis]TQM53616.1 PTS system N-acetylglucosamine-specific IIA component (Glc family) [Halopolyspora algeriensis]
MSVEVVSPVSGLTAPLGEVPDPVFSQAMVGPGMAVKPRGGRGDAVAPVAGTVATLHPHAFVITTPEGFAVLVHLGLDTVKLGGEGFTAHVTQGETVRVGQRIITWDPTGIEAHGFSSICPVVVLEIGADALGDLREDDQVLAGEAVFTVQR